MDLFVPSKTSSCDEILSKSKRMEGLIMKMEVGEFVLIPKKYMSSFYSAARRVNHRFARRMTEEGTIKMYLLDKDYNFIVQGMEKRSVQKHKKIAENYVSPYRGQEDDTY